MCFFKIYLYIIFALHLILYCPPLLNNGQSNNGARAKGYEARFDSTHNKIGKNNVTLRFSMSTETSQIEILKTDSITLLTYKLSTGSISSWIVILSFRTCPCYCFKLNAKTISKICWSPQFWQPGEKWLPTLIIKYICDKDMYTDTHSLSRIHPHTQRAFFACTNVICCFIHLRAHLSASQVVPPVQMHSSSGWPWAPPPSGTLGLPRCYSGLWHHSGRLQHIQYAAVAHGPRGTGTWWGLWTIRKEVWWIDTNRTEWRRFSPWKESSSSPGWKPVLWKTEPFLTVQELVNPGHGICIKLWQKVVTVWCVSNCDNFLTLR